MNHVNVLIGSMRHAVKRNGCRRDVENKLDERSQNAIHSTSSDDDVMMFGTIQLSFGNKRLQLSRQPLCKLNYHPFTRCSLQFFTDTEQRLTARGTC